jgi:hypothetical protein
MRLACVILLASVFLVACGGESSPTGPDGPIAFSDVFRDKVSNLTTRRAEIVSRSARWDTVWSEIGSSAPKPAVDFESKILIVAALGETGDSCKHVRITGVTRQMGGLNVTIAETRLPPSCVCPPNTVRPVHVVSVPRAASTATFNWTTLTEGAPCTN